MQEPGRTRYFSRSWAMLTRDKGWIKPILLLALGMIVPIVGWLAVVGYAFEWARLSAWGVDSAPKQRDVRIGECIASGWRVFVVEFVWLAVWGLVAGLVTRAFGFVLGGSVEDFISNVFGVLLIFYTLVTYVAALRAVVYTKIIAGLNPKAVFEMVARDSRGLLKLVLIYVGAGFTITLIVVILCVAVVAAAFGQMAQLYYLSYGYGSSSLEAISAFSSFASAMLPWIIIIVYVVSVVAVAAELLLANSIGLWMAQFDVPSWGGPNDPLPENHTPSPAVGLPPVTKEVSAPEPPTESSEPVVTEPSPAVQEGTGEEAKPEASTVDEQPAAAEESPTPEQPAAAEETTDSERPVALEEPTSDEKPAVPEEPAAPSDAADVETSEAADQPQDEASEGDNTDVPQA